MDKRESLIRDFRAALAVSPAWVQFGRGQWIRVCSKDYVVTPDGVGSRGEARFFFIPWACILQVVPDSIKCELGYN